MLKQTILGAVELLVLAPAPLGATTLVRMSLEQLAAAADAVVQAHCLGSESRRDAGEVWTFVTFDVQESLKGVVPRFIAVRLPGGRWGHVTVRIEGVPQFQAGEEVVLFLQRTSAGDFAVTSWMQGTFRLRHDEAGAEARVTQDSGTLAVFDPAAQKFRYDGIRQAPLGEFRRRLKGILAKQRSERSQ